MAPADSGACDKSLAKQLQDAFPRLGIKATGIEILAPAEAMAIAIHPPEHETSASIRAWLDARGLPVDIALLPPGRRQKKLLIADMDSTIIGQECIDEMGAALGIGKKIARITEKAMRGEIVFEDALRERVNLLKGLAVSRLQNVMDTRISLNSGARALVRTMRANGAYTALISGGFTFFAEQVADQAGFHEMRANRLAVADDRLTGEVIPPIIGHQAKRQRLDDLCRALDITARDTIAVGDGANDLGMIEAAGLGVAYYAKPVVAARADVQINHTDLHALAYLQGYRRDAIVAP